MNLKFLSNQKPKFKLSPDEIKPLTKDTGYCLATNMITVEGKKINFMYKEILPNSKPNNSGWNFFSGDENQDYTKDSQNIQLFDVNTIANYDPDIIPFLESSDRTAFERNPKTGKFEQVFDFKFGAN
jgi:hypothetical protein